MLRDTAQHRWPGILLKLGLPARSISGKHGPCPICGGSDRFRLDNKNGLGTYYCTCGPGDGFNLLMKFHGWDFKTTAREVEKIVGEVGTEIKQEQDPKVRLKKIQSACKDLSEDGVTRYLRNRGLSRYPESLKIARLPYYEDGKKLGVYDTMVAKLVSADNKPLTFHLTYLEDGAKADVPSPKKVMKPVAPIAGGAVRLFPLESHMAIAEGIETALAVNELTHIPCWSVLSANGMEKFQVPAGVKKLTIYADNDNNFTGQKAAYTLAHRLALQDIDVLVCVPSIAGMDWLDVLGEENEIRVS